MTIDASRANREYPLYAYFIGLATVFYFFTVENINFLFIAIATLGLGALIFFHINSIPKSKNGLLALIFIFIVTVNLWNYESTRWSSVVYSCFFIITYALYTPFFRHYLDVTQFRKLLKIVFYLYFIGLVIGQLNVYFNQFAPLSGVIGFMRGSFGTIQEKEGVRFFSLSSEPSYAAFIVLTLFYTYYKLEPRKDFFYKRENVLLFVILMYMIFMFKSAYGALLFCVLVVEYVGFSKSVVLMTIILVGIISIITILDIDIRALNRVLNVIQNIDLSDPHGLYIIDFTAYYRVAPVLNFVETARWDDAYFLLGHGAGASRLYVVPEIYSGYIGGEFLGGFMPAFFYDYGIIGAGMVLLFLFQQVRPFFSFQTVVVMLMLLNANFNTQLFWFIVLCFHLLTFYLNNPTNVGTSAVVEESKLPA